MSGCGLWGDLICSAWGLAGLPRLPCRLSGLKSFHASNILKLWELMGIDWDKVWLMIRLVWRSKSLARACQFSLNEQSEKHCKNQVIKAQSASNLCGFAAWTSDSQSSNQLAIYACLPRIQRLGPHQTPTLGVLPIAAQSPQSNHRLSSPDPKICESYNFVSTNFRIPGMVKGKT